MITAAELAAALRDYERDQDSQFLTEIRYSATHVDAAVFANDIPDRATFFLNK